MVGQIELARLLGGALGELDDRLDHRLEAAMAEHHGAEHVVLGQLLRLGLDHQHRVAGTGDDEIELGLLHLVEQRIEHEGAVDQADAGAADRAHERHAGERQRRRRRDQRDDVGIVLEVMAEDGRDDLGLAAEAVGEERADRAVDETRGQRLLLGRPALALEEAAGDLAGGEGLLLVVHGEREEVDSRLLGMGRDHGRQHRGLTIGGEDGAVGLARDPAGFENERTARPFDLDTLDVEHGSSFHTSDGREGEPWTRRRDASSCDQEKASGDPAMAFVRAHPWPARRPHAAARC